jgi:hypothetical protein
MAAGAAELDPVWDDMERYVTALAPTSVADADCNIRTLGQLFMAGHPCHTHVLTYCLFIR